MAQVTGSFVLAAVAFVTNEQGAVTKVLAIPVFLLAAAVTTVSAVTVERRGRAPIAGALGLECAVLTAFLLAVLASASADGPNAAEVVVVSLLGFFAIGTQSAAVRLMMRSVASTNVMIRTPRNSRSMRLSWRLRGRRGARARRCSRRGGLRRGPRPGRAPVPDHVRILLGTAAGTLTYVATGVWGLLLPLAIMYGIFAWASLRRPSGGSER